MIAFVTLFLGLVSGSHTVELAVSEPVAVVELRLDGEAVGVIREAPWSAEVDFGAGLTSHELVAVARDGEGTEIGRAVQRVNVPRPGVEAEILLEEWESGLPGQARLLWSSALSSEPASVRWRLDGEALMDGGEGGAFTVTLPELDPGRVHFLDADLELADGSAATAETVFGGLYGEASETDLTAVPLEVEGRGASRERLDGWLRSEGRALPVLAFEEGEAEVVVVRGEDALYRLRVLVYQLAEVGLAGSRAPGLGDGAALHFLSPRPVRHPGEGIPYDAFSVAGPFTPEDGSVPGLLVTVGFQDKPRLRSHLSDAVATAGLKAAASQRRRAVVLVTRDCAEVSGRWSVEEVRAFLAELRVPLRVRALRSPEDRARGFCPLAEEISDPRGFYTVVKKLRRALGRQRIAWVEGRHLPREVTLAEDATGVRWPE